MNYLTSILFAPKIPVICIRQPISKSLNSSISKQIRALRNIKAVAIVLDSEKGEAVQTQKLTANILLLAKKHNVPIYSFVEQRCLGEPYQLVSIATKSYCLPSSVIGLHRSIHWFGVKPLLQQFKIQTRTFSNNRNLILRQLNHLESQDRSSIKGRLQSIQKAIADQAVTTTQSNQGNKVLLTDQHTIGDEAVRAGLVGGLGNLYSVLDKEFPGSRLKMIQHSTVFSSYLAVGLALPFVVICLILLFKTTLKYTILLFMYLFYKQKSKGKESGSKQGKTA